MLVTLSRSNGGIMRSPRKSIAFKSFAGVFGLLVIFTIVMGAIGLGVFSDAILEQYSNGAFRTARSAALMVNADRMEEYLKSGGKTEEYMEVYTHLDRLCNSQDATFVYVIQPDTTDYEHITFVFSTMNRNSHYTH